jgi:GT2 family glycosyltransferase
MEDNNPLVTILVVTYNSSRFVLETLESAKYQTYENIELIVTDDNSSDETIDICRKWIEENKLRFVRTKIVTANRNTGIPANFNRGVNVSNGLWIKCIAGDDLLAEDCIQELIYYIHTQQEDIRILSSDIVKFFENSIKEGRIEKNPNVWFCSRESSAKDQYEMLLRFNRVFASTVIIRRDLLLSVHGFDERFKLLEDWPLWIKITSAGYKIYHLEKALIFYRLHENNLSQTTDQSYIYHPVNRIDISFKEKEIIHRLPIVERLGMKYEILGIKACFLLGNSKNNPFTRFIYYFFKISNLFNIFFRMGKTLGIKSSNKKYS